MSPRLVTTSALLIAFRLAGDAPAAVPTDDPPQRKTIDLRSEVEGRVAILSIKPDGSRVIRGEMVAELDSAGFRDALDAQRIASEGAKANYENSVKTAEIAWIAIKDYEEVIFKQSIEAAEEVIARAEGDLAKAGDARKRVEEMVKEGNAPEGKAVQERLGHRRAEISLREAQTKLRVLRDFTYSRTIAELEADVEKATVDRLSKLTTYYREQRKEEKLRRQIEKCKLFAPASGKLLHADLPGDDPDRPTIAEGAVVASGQKILRIVPDDDAPPR